VQLTVN